MGTGYQQEKKLWVPMRTGCQSGKSFWVPGTDQIKNCGYRWVPGTGQKKVFGYPSSSLMQGLNEKANRDFLKLSRKNYPNFHFAFQNYSKFRENQLPKLKFSRNSQITRDHILNFFDANFFVGHQLRVDRGSQNSKVRWGHSRLNLRLYTKFGA